MHINHAKLIHGALFLASAFLTACGGGGGGAATPAATYTIGGTVSGLAGTVVLQNNGGNDLSITGNGSFTFTTKIAGGAAYSVAVLTQPAGQTCTASSNSGNVGSANITSVSVICSANALSIGGSITGLAGTVVLRNNGGDNLTISTAGTSNFTFTTPVARGAAYAVTVFTQPANQRCTVTSGSGTNVQANVTSVAVSCVPVYTIGGTVTGLGTSIGLVLKNSGNNNLSITGNGPFAFSNGLAEGDAYDVKVLIQPAAPALTCMVTGGTSGTGSGTMGTSAVNVTVACSTPVPSYAYVANQNSLNVSAYSINQATGVLTSVGPAVAAGSNPQSVIVVPSGKFAYVANLVSGDISAYTINALSGVLTQVSCGGGAGCNNISPATGANFLAGNGPIAVTVDPSGQFAYVANVNSNNISAYAINASTGALTSIGAAVATGNKPSSVTVDHTGKFAYVANANDNSVSAYTIVAATGVLTPVLCGGGPTCETVTGNDFLAGNGPQSLDIDPTSRFAYVANANDNTISAYTIDALTGALTPIDANTGMAGIQNFMAGTTPTSIAVDPSGKYVYAANKLSNDISAYSIDNATGTGTGALTAIAGPFLAGTLPTSITVDLSGKFVYVANEGTNDISAYSIGGTGALSAIASSPFAAGTKPASVTTTVLY